MHYSQYLEHASIWTATNEASEHVCDTEDITIESVDAGYDAMLDDDLVIDDALVAGATYYKSKRKSTTANHLSKIWKISQETSKRTIENATQRCSR